MIVENKMFTKMRSGEPVLGCQIRSRSTLIAELAGYSGLDYVFIEGEHFAHNIETVESLTRAIQIGGATPIIRIPSHEDGLILQVLESGVMGIIFPHIDNKEQALHAVNEVKFPPIGHRGYGDSARASKFGYIPDEQFFDYSNRNVLCIGMIESKRGIDNLEGILESGIDVLRIGARDLSLDLGYGGKVTKEVKTIVIDLCKRISKSKVILGDAGLGGLDSQEDFDFVKNLGCKMFTMGSEMTLIKKTIASKINIFTEMKLHMN